MGTALIVIIPEGVETLYSASDYGGDAHTRRSFPQYADLTRDPIHILTVREDSTHSTMKFKPNDAPESNPFNALPGPALPPDVEAESNMPSKTPPLTPTEPGKVGILEHENLANPPRPDTTPISDSHSTDLHPSHTPHAWIGISLIFGFILMYLLDTLPLLAPPAPTRPQSNIYSLSDLSTSPPPPTSSPQRSLSTTLGLCIHAAADGIALGASSTSTSTSSLSLIIFVAIMVHKAPAAFGLTSVLLKQGLGKRGARAHLVVFSLAAPAGALATWLVVRALGEGGASEPALMKWWTGVLLLFSGGTFL